MNELATAIFSGGDMCIVGKCARELGAYTRLNPDRCFGLVKRFVDGTPDEKRLLAELVSRKMSRTYTRQYVLQFEIVM